jgi:hypothetical protein
MKPGPARRATRVFALAATLAMVQGAAAVAQGVDCARLQREIAYAGNGGGGRFAAAARKQGIEIARTAAYAHQMGCDRQGFGIFGGGPPPQCGAINARVAQMQANLAQLQTGASGQGGRAALIARFNAYCRGGPPPAPPQERGFFESLFGGPPAPPPPPPPADIPRVTEEPSDGGDGGEGGSSRGHGGSQAVCVRTCDGGFFPLPLSSHHNQDSLNEMCAALCPGTQTAVYTRNPNSEIKTAVSLDGNAYMDLPNALKFQKSFDAACTCRPPGKSWAEALVGAEEVLGHQRKGDIMVTPEKSVELSRPKLDDKTRAALLRGLPDANTPVAAAPAPLGADQTREEAGPDGVTRHVRTVAPQL